MFFLLCGVGENERTKFYRINEICEDRVLLHRFGVKCVIYEVKMKWNLYVISRLREFNENNLMANNYLWQQKKKSGAKLK